MQDYACLYTSHATNLAYATGNTSFRTLSDLMPHDRMCLEADMAEGLVDKADVEGEADGQDAELV